MPESEPTQARVHPHRPRRVVSQVHFKYGRQRHGPHRQGFLGGPDHERRAAAVTESVFLAPHTGHA